MSDFGNNRQWSYCDNVDDVALKYILDNFSPSTMIDIGCGRGIQVENARSMGVEAVGVDGSQELTIYDKPYFFLHDYTQGKIDLGDFDLAWSVEFVEHVYEKYIPNFLDTFAKCRMVFFTHAVPGQGGNHHVNCQTGEYWLNIFKKYGFEKNEETTSEVRSVAENKYIRRTGTILINKGSE
ncbi:unnamed protein product [marine sediment metagenome]|uniref:Uncharacterized protein n=1 Tax=marine sediment metagenome TaxID=412755 RepID=X0XAJ0_9ZZZZ